MATTSVNEQAITDLAGVVWRLWRAADEAFVAAGPGGDLDLDFLSLAARSVAADGATLVPDPQLCDVPASAESDPGRLIREAEAVLAARPIEQWPTGTSALVVDVCDLIREHRL